MHCDNERSALMSGKYPLKGFLAVFVQSFSSLLWAFSKMGIRPPTSYLDRASEVMERREIEGLQVCSSLNKLRFMTCEQQKCAPWDLYLNIFFLISA